MQLSISAVKLVTSLLQQSPAKGPTKLLHCQVTLRTAQQQLYKLTASCMIIGYSSNTFAQLGVAMAVQ